MPDFKVGDRVFMPENKNEDWHEERGIIEEIDENGLLTVLVDDPIGPYDDGYREVLPEDAELEK